MVKKLRHQAEDETRHDSDDSTQPMRADSYSYNRGYQQVGLSQPINHSHPGAAAGLSQHPPSPAVNQLPEMSGGNNQAQSLPRPGEQTRFNNFSKAGPSTFLPRPELGEKW
jgi:hypothetical protein